MTKKVDKCSQECFYNSACNKKNVQACPARGNKGKIMTSVDKVNKTSDVIVKKVGSWKGIN